MDKLFQIFGKKEFMFYLITSQSHRDFFLLKYLLYAYQNGLKRKILERKKLDSSNYFCVSMYSLYLMDE